MKKADKNEYLTLDALEIEKEKAKEKLREEFKAKKIKAREEFNAAQKQLKEEFFKKEREFREEKRKQEDSKKFVLGGFYLKKFYEDDNYKKQILKILEGELNNNYQRELFGLSPLEDTSPPSTAGAKAKKTPVEPPSKNLSVTEDKVKVELAPSIEKPAEENSGKETEPEKCPQCENGTIILKHRKSDNAPFWGCSEFPKCRYVKNYTEK